MSGISMEEFNINELAGATGLILGAVSGILVVIFKSRCYCKFRVGFNDRCSICMCERKPPPDNNNSDEEGNEKQDKILKKEEKILKKEDEILDEVESQKGTPIATPRATPRKMELIVEPEPQSETELIIPKK